MLDYFKNDDGGSSQYQVPLDEIVIGRLMIGENQ
jgi:hypothetical protein